MELRLLSDQNLLATTSHGTVAFLATISKFEHVATHEKPAVVIAFEPITTKRSNREILICDWPGEYEKSEVSVIGPANGVFLVALEGKTWLVVQDSHISTLDHDAEQLNTVEGVMVWLTDGEFKPQVQKLIDRLEPAHLIYVGGPLHYGAELLPPAPVAVSELVLKSTDWSSTTEQIVAHTLQS